MTVSIEKSNTIEDQMNNLDSKIENIELVNAPESCLNLVAQGLNKSQKAFLDPDGNNKGAAPIPIFCKLPEAVAISGEEVEIPINSQSADAGFFNYEIQYDDNTLDQLIALTKVSSKCTQTFEFNCFWAPMKDLVSYKYCYL